MRSNRKKTIFFLHLSLCGLLVISLGIPALGFVGSQAWAGEKNAGFLFNINQQEITEALKEVATKAGYQLLFSAEQIGVQKVTSLSGHYTAEEALSLLLQDTGLSFEITARGVIVIKKTHPIDSEEGISMKNKNRFLSGFLSSLVGVVGVQGAVSAQTQDVERGRSAHALEEVVVTAQRREQSLQDVPVSVVALTEAQLENL